MDILQRYSEQISEEIKISRVNIQEAQLTLPSKKHFWVARLIDHKKKLFQLKKKKEKLVKVLIENKQVNSPVTLSKNNQEKILEANETVEKLTEEITEQEFLIEYLEKVEKVFSALSFDIKNIIELIKMETM